MFSRTVSWIATLAISGFFLISSNTQAEVVKDIRAHVAWSAYQDNSFKVLFSSYRRGRWQEPSTIYETDNEVASVVSSTLRNGEKIVFWTEVNRLKREIFYGILDFSESATLTIKRVRKLSTGCDSCLAVFPILESDGFLRLFWSDTKDGLDDIFTARYDGIEWSQFERVNHLNDVPDILPVAELDYFGNTVVQWKSYSRVAGRYLTAKRQFGSNVTNGENQQKFADISANQIPRPADLPYNSRLFYHLPENQLRKNVFVNGPQSR